MSSQNSIDLTPVYSHLESLRPVLTLTSVPERRNGIDMPPDSRDHPLPHLTQTVIRFPFPGLL